MKIYIFAIICLIFLLIYQLGINRKFVFIDQNVVISTEENLDSTKSTINLIRDFTINFYDEEQFEKDIEYIIIKDMIRERKGLIILSRNIDIISDGINFAFIPINGGILELNELDDEHYLLRVKSSDVINPIAYGDIDYFKFVKELSAMLIEYENLGQYYFPLYSISKDTLHEKTNLIFIGYNLNVEEIKIINNSNDINLNDSSVWKKHEAITINEVREAFCK